MTTPRSTRSYPPFSNWLTKSQKRAAQEAALGKQRALRELEERDKRRAREHKVMAVINAIEEYIETRLSGAPPDIAAQSLYRLRDALDENLVFQEGE